MFNQNSYEKLLKELNKIQDTVRDIDRRLCYLEGAFQYKKCSILHSSPSHKTAEGA